MPEGDGTHREHQDAKDDGYHCVDRELSKCHGVLRDHGFFAVKPMVVISALRYDQLRGCRRLYGCSTMRVWHFSMALPS